MKLISKLVVAAFAASAAVTAGAQEAAQSGYLVDGSGKVVSTGSGGCWHTGSWTPAMAMEPCDPSAKPVAAYVAPVAEVAPAPAPEPVVAAPAPVVAEVVPAPAPQAVSFTGDALFAFDKSELTAEGKSMLDDLVGRLQGATVDTIVITGHADRIGGAEYNQQLSERRAAAVKDYLAGKNVTAGRIDAQGKGSAEPITALGECRDLQGSKATIACLQPDRRVEVAMTGSKLVLGSQSTGEYIDDATITAKVKAAIFNDATLKSNDISVKTLEGRVQLSGFVDTSADIAQAGTVARGVGGVTSVKNDLRLK